MNLEGGKFLTACLATSAYTVSYNSELESYWFVSSPYPSHYVNLEYGTSVTSLGIDCSTYGCLTESYFSWI